MAVGLSIGTFHRELALYNQGKLEYTLPKLKPQMYLVQENVPTRVNVPAEVNVPAQVNVPNPSYSSSILPLTYHSPEMA